VRDALAMIALVFGVTVLAVGVVRLLMVPFAVYFELRRHRQPADAPPVAGSIFAEPPLVSVIVPAYNEAVVLESCVRSITRSRYEPFEVVCVDDGSTDDTYERLRALADELPSVQAITRPNGGKGAALNTGIAASSGQVLMLVDADGVFGPDTITEMIRGFDDERVGAVCGDDRTVNLDRVQTRFLAIISHLGTGLMRRALSVLRVLPIVSGNTGAYRREVLEVTGGLREDTVGEDLELTWRVHRAGYLVAFTPRALVYAESPSTFRGLCRQRVRWARGLIQTSRLHRTMIGNPRYRGFGLYLAFNAFNQIAVPFIQVVALAVLLILAAMGDTSSVPLDFWAWVAFVGLPISLALLVLALGLDRAFGDLRHAWTLPLWPIYSAALSLVMLRAVWLEVRGAENRWNKLERTGVVSVRPSPGDGHGSSP
jgi:poly-beta-1,6-N-acetyl-D-glucosamine synthase